MTNTSITIDLTQDQDRTSLIKRKFAGTKYLHAVKCRALPVNVSSLFLTRNAAGVQKCYIHFTNK